MVLRALVSSLSLFAFFFFNLEMPKLAYRQFDSKFDSMGHQDPTWLPGPAVASAQNEGRRKRKATTGLSNCYKTRTLTHSGTKGLFFKIFFFLPNHIDAQLLRQDSSSVTLQCHLQINIWSERRLEINREVVKTGVHCCDAGRARGRRRVSLSVSSRELHAQHTWDKQHVWFWQKIDFREKKKDEISLRIKKKKKKRVHNDDNERWSLYTKKARTLRPSLFGC